MVQAGNEFCVSPALNIQRKAIDPKEGASPMASAVPSIARQQINAFSSWFCLRRDPPRIRV